MSGQNALSWAKLVGIIIGSVLVGVAFYFLYKFLLYLKDKLSSAADFTYDNVVKPVVTAPINAVNKATEAVTGDPSFGGWVYSVTHSDPLSQTEMQRVLTENGGAQNRPPYYASIPDFVRGKFVIPDYPPFDPNTYWGY